MPVDDGLAMMPVVGARHPSQSAEELEVGSIRVDFPILTESMLISQP